jgi:tetratricopeptide (TPR) repeat protein
MIGLGSVLYSQGKVNEAILTLQQATMVDPKSGTAFFNLGVALQAARKLSQSATAYRKAATLPPKATAAPAYNNLSNVLREMQDLPGAIAAARKAIALAPTYAPAYRNLGQALLADGQTAKGNAALAKANRLDGQR